MKHHSVASIFLVSIIVIAFGWGSLWAMSHGAKIAFNKATISYSVQSANENSAEGSGSIPESIKTISDVSTTTTENIFKKAIESLNPFSTNVKIVMSGDVMLDRKMRQFGERNGYASLFSGLIDIFRKQDIVVVNLEGPITTNPSKTLLANGQTTSELTFTFAPKTAEALKDVGISIVSLANNHTDNFGISGLNETRKFLDSAGVGYFGDPWNSTSSVKLLNKGGMDIAFVGYHQFQPGFDKVLTTIKNLSKNYFVIVMPHWGDEYVPSPNDLMVYQAKKMVDAGADLIVGSHPHVVIKNSFVGDVPVFYSLGNLVFDQYFSEAVLKGNLLEIELKKSHGKTVIGDIDVYKTSMSARDHVTLLEKVETITINK